MKKIWSVMMKNKLFCIIAFTILIRLIFAGFHQIAGDACWHMLAAEFISETGSLPTIENLGRPCVFWAPPAFHIAAALILKMFSWSSETLALFFVRMITPVLGGFGLVYLYLLYRKLKFKKRTIFFSMIFICFTPLLMYYGYLPYGSIQVMSLMTISLYYLLDKRPLISGVFCGLALLTKDNAIPMAFIFLWLLYKEYLCDKKKALSSRIGQILLFSVPVLAMSGWWYIRNFQLMGKPLYLITQPHSTLAHFLEPITYFMQFLGFFGVPSSNPANLAMVESKIALGIWFALCLLYLIPFVPGILRFRSIQNKGFLIAGLLGYFLFYIDSVYLRGFEAYIRYIMPIMIFVAIFWGHGMDYLYSNRSRRCKQVISVLLLICIALFILQEPVKLYVADKFWTQYEPAFSWVKENTPEDAVFKGIGMMGQSTCMPYRISREVITPTKPFSADTIYVWIDGDSDHVMPATGVEIYNDPAMDIRIYTIDYSEDIIPSIR